MRMAGFEKGGRREKKKEKIRFKTTGNKREKTPLAALGDCSERYLSSFSSSTLFCPVLQLRSLRTFHTDK